MTNEEVKITLKEALDGGLKEGVLLSDYTTIKVGGLADYLFVADSVENLALAVSTAYKCGIDFRVIGAGSNVIASDFGFPGIIIVNKSSNYAINADNGEAIADSGISVSKLLSQTASQDLGGIEFLAGVPGTLGGAVYGNAGAKNTWIGDYVRSVTLLEEKMGEIKVIRRNRAWLDFKYRSSKLKRDFKGKKFRPVILSVKLQLTQKRRDSVIKLIHENQIEKKEKQPLNEKSAGSFFKNPGQSKEESAGYLLDKSGAKKISVNGASVSKKHANFIINSNNASAEDIRRLANKLKEKVSDNFNIELEEEIEYLGKW